MKTNQFLMITLAASSLLFVTSAVCLIMQPDLGVVAPVWGVIILVSITSLAAFFLMSEDPRKGCFRVGTLLYLVVAAMATSVAFGGLFSQNFTIVRPIGLGASFSYRFLLSLLALVAGVLGVKESLEAIYNYSQKGREVLIFAAIRLSAIIALFILGGILAVIIYKGIWAISWEFLTQPHRRLGQEGGISTAIAGSLWMVIGAMLVSAPLGIGAAIYLNEYSRDLRMNRLVTIAVSVLNGVPSVVFGLFGLAFLVTLFGVSLLSGSLILGLINIPTIILTSQEALKSVPNSLREGSMALGASKWQTITKVVLPAALPGILTGIIIGVAKASGETAPIMWTAVTFTSTPVQMIYGVVPNIFQPVNNLDYHLLNLIYFLGAWDVEENAWGTALVLLAMVLSTNMLAIVVRNHYRKRISW